MPTAKHYDFTPFSTEYNTILCVQTVKWESHSSHNLLLEIIVLLSQVEGARFISLCRIENSRVRSVGWKFYPRRSIYLEGKLLLPQNERSSAPALEGNTCFSRYFYHGHASFPPSPLHVHETKIEDMSITMFRSQRSFLGKLRAQRIL